MRKLVSILFVLLVSGFTLMAQSKKVTGKVTDENGTPIANASVLVKGTSIGTTTNAEGMFELNAPASSRTLVISSLNFTAKEVNIGSGSVTVALTSAVNELTEVVVSVPYGTVKKSTFTGSAGTINSATIQKQQVTSVTRVLEGLVPGLATTNGGGTPGGGTDIRIRGFGSINASASPLIVLNGIPYDGSISAIASDEIETVDVLKDAAASNLYGSRAANGVIMITTKKGKKGPAQIQASIRHGISTRGIPEYDRVGAKEYYELFWESYRNSYVFGSGQSYAAAGTSASNVLTSSSGLVYNAYNVPGNQLVDATTGKLNPNAKLLWNESWADALFQNATRTNVNVNVSGANDKTNYLVSGGYLNEKGIAKFSGYNRYNFRADVNTEANNWLKVGLTVDGATDKREGLFAGGTATSNPFYYSRQMGPIYPVYQYNATGSPVLGADGKPALDWGVPAQMGARPYAANSNLIGSLALDRREQKRLNANINTYAEIRFQNDFTFKTTLGMNYFQVDGLTYQNSEFGDASNVKGRSTVSAQKNVSLTGNQVLSWNKKLFDRHNVRALVGHENYQFRTSFLSATKTGFSYPGQTALNNAAVVEAPPSSSEDLHRIESYFGSINYDFDGKYLLSGSLRTDGSSRFAPDVRWGNFYSVGIGWRIKQENFMKDVDWLNDLKLKASYGESGNDNIGLYYQYINYYYADGFGNFSPITRPANPDLKWEGNKTLNYGVDFSMFKRRLQGTVEYFDRRSDDLLFLTPTEPSFLFPNVWQNIGESKNYGIEIQLAYNIIQKKDFDWKIDFNATHFKNKLTKIPPKQKELGGIVTGNKKYNEGRSIYDFWLREFAGVDPATGLSLYYRDILGANGKPTGERILTSDITRADFYYVGASSIPKIYGGVTNSLRYKDFQLSILTTYSYGGHFYDGNYQSIMHSGAAGTAWHTDIQKRWQKPGDVTNVPRLQNAGGQDGASSRFLFDASYINIKNVSFSYNLSSGLARNLRLKDAQFFVSIDNAYIFTAKSGGDPQQSFDGNVGAGYPPYRTITFGTTIKL
ncbi:MAG: SusC/RagA family TonB-linked outer membrane protein [Chitinophagaceae bacterium]|nr:SusC/RagA family TonB-linked outer membrane protein [Chitinophagaceae bacterium]